jgi:hypothetical protein
VSTFQSAGLVFAIDRTGAEIDAPHLIELDVGYDVLGIDPESAPEEMGKRLSGLFGEPIEDEEGIFDLVVSKDGAVVAALVLACEDDALALGGERSSEIDDDGLATALVRALGGAR